MKPEVFRKRVGERIVELRKGKNLTQSQLARAAGKDPQSLHKAERGEFNFSAHYVYQLAEALGISLAEFWDFDMTEDKTNNP